MPCRAAQRSPVQSSALPCSAVQCSAFALRLRLQARIASLGGIEAVLAAIHKFDSVPVQVSGRPLVSASRFSSYAKAEAEAEPGWARQYRLDCWRVLEYLSV